MFTRSLIVAIAIACIIPLSPTSVSAQTETKENIIWQEQESNGPLDENGGDGTRHTLFDWRIGRDNGDEDDSEPYDDSLASDRPDFTEASRNVGRGHIQLEMGYTFTTDSRDGTRFNGHSYPEMLLRIGLFRDWFELRIGQNFGNERTRDPAGPFTADGAQDLYLGIGLNLTEQKSFLPEMRLILQTFVPTGNDDFSADRMLPGANLCYSWEVSDFLTLAGSTQLNRAVDDSGEDFIEFAQSISVGYSLTEKLGAYTEWFGIFPSGARAPDTVPVHFFNGGFTFLATENLQFDIRAGVGLNDHADDFFTGAGFVYLY